MTDGLHEVRLAEADAAVQEQRVVAVARSFSHRLCGRVRELRVMTHNE